MLQLNPKQTIAAVSACLDLNVALMLWGSPGVGKSDVVRHVAAQRDAQLLDIRLSQYDSVDLRGTPMPHNGLTVWNPPATLPFEGNPHFDPTRPIILFLDEIVQALPAVQSVAFQLVLDRRVGEHVLMPNVMVVAASNRAQDRAGGYRMSTPLANRFTHIEQVVHLDAWCDWAWDNDVAPLVVAFLRMRPELLNTFDPAKGDTVFASPRAWNTVSKVVKRNLPADVRYALVAGTVGEGPAAEFETFVRTWESMPNIDNILADPAGAEVPRDPAVIYAVCAALSFRATPANFDAVVDYAMRLPREFTVSAIKPAVRKTPTLANTKAFNKFAADFADVYSE